MKLLYVYTVFFAAILFCQKGYAQQRQLTFTNIQTNDTLTIDSLTIIPSSLVFIVNQDTINPKYTLINGSGKIISHQPFASLKVNFSSLPINLADEQFNKDTTLILKENLPTQNAAYTLQSAQRTDPAFFDGLNKSGSLSRGITVGNSQDAVLNSSLNLQLSGNINENTTIKASITDNQVPVNTQGVSQTLNEFDRVFIEVENDQIGKIRAGDYDIGSNQQHFLNFNKRISGAGVLSPIKMKNGVLTINANGALARGEFNRNTFNGQEGNQGPYKLVGKNNELTLLIISGSERVYIDGILLKRGLENDYIIDYSTGEVTFTSLRPITKDRRIVVEFQYTVQNYIRSIIYGGADYKTKKWQHGFSIYSEQDAKNQPLIPLTQSDKEQLFYAGNNAMDAVKPSWRQVNYDSNKILYALKDTLGSDSVFVYSTNPSDTLYEVFFSYLGPNLGNYISSETSTNGRVYTFVAPINNIPQGTHAPYSALPLPQQLQVFSYNGKYTTKKQDVLFWDVAYSKNNPNTFSPDRDVLKTGVAAKAGYDKKWKKNAWNYQATAEAEHNSKNFETVERIRNVEFSRDWNIQNNTAADLTLGNVLFLAQNKNKLKLQYSGQALNLGENYMGIRNNANVYFHKKGWYANSHLSYLTTKDSSAQSEFFRQKTHLQKNFKNLIYTGIKSQSEYNLQKGITTSNTNLSYKFLDNSAFVGYGDTLKAYIETGVFQRTDDTIRDDQWQRAALAQGIYAKANINHQKWGNLFISGQYRSLLTFNDSIETQLNSITTRLQYRNRLFKNFVGLNTFYESGMGSEPKKDYKYLKVPKGTGTYIWVDYNGNGVEELDEFELTPFQDQGEYIRIFVVTRAYVPISKIKFSQQVDFNFNKVAQAKSLLGKLTLQTYVLLERKELLTSSTNSLNPFKQNIGDSLLIQSIENYRSTLFYNRSSPIYGGDYTFQQNTAKNLLSYGLENVRIQEHTLNMRYLLKKKFDLRLTLKNSNKENNVPSYQTRNYYIQSQSAKPVLAFQGSPYLRISADYTLQNSANTLEGEEKLTAQKLGSEIQFNHPQKMNFLARVEYVNNAFTGNEFSPVGYEMLSGLQNGDNLLWQASIQKNLTTFLQIVLNYNGRSSAGNPVIHTGTVEVKAFF